MAAWKSYWSSSFSFSLRSLAKLSFPFPSIARVVSGKSQNTMSSATRSASPWLVEWWAGYPGQLFQRSCVPLNCDRRSVSLTARRGNDGVLHFRVAVQDPKPLSRSALPFLIRLPFHTWPRRDTDCLCQVNNRVAWFRYGTSAKRRCLAKACAARSLASTFRVQLNRP